ncbi:MAG: hypothetical protein AAEJ52_04585 [Myxococcota bacterium]
MADVELAAAPPRAHLIERLRPRLGELVPGLRVIAESLLGADSKIDFVAIEPSGRVVLILVGESGEDLQLVGRALAQRAWVEPRVRDWIQLAPSIAARPVAGVRVLLLCPDFCAQTEAAVASLGNDVVSLARFRCLRNGADLHLLFEGTPGAPAAPADPPEMSALPPFRTGLTDEDLGLTDEERDSLE